MEETNSLLLTAISKYVDAKKHKPPHTVGEAQLQFHKTFVMVYYENKNNDRKWSTPAVYISKFNGDIFGDRLMSSKKKIGNVYCYLNCS